MSTSRRTFLKLSAMTGGAVGLNMIPGLLSVAADKNPK
ncbi:MAG: twin-arginine translocation signal domain-containing protein, partial [Pyrinomonadaceae bacterium]